MDHADLSRCAPARTNQSCGTEPIGRLIEFPRRGVVTDAWIDALADPVMERPRILEVPETEFLPPALGGISIEPIPVADEGKRPGIEIPMLTAPMWRRMAAGAIDGVFVAIGNGLVRLYFFPHHRTVPHYVPQSSAESSDGVLWAGYQYLLLVYSGTTPGLKLAGLELNRFDGTTSPRRLRRWRVLASILSAPFRCVWVMPGVIWMKTSCAGTTASPKPTWRRSRKASGVQATIAAKILFLKNRLTTTSLTPQT